MHDIIQKFMFEHHGVRGALVHLRQAYQHILHCHPYPAAVQQPLGQLLAGCALLSATLKFDGSLIIQTQTKGSIRQLVAQCNHHFHVRGLALWDESIAADQQQLGEGLLAITMVPTDGKERYQGVVALTDEHLHHCIEQYFEQSEQLPTRLWLFANESTAAGLLLQKMPNALAEDYPHWETAYTLANTITAAELLNLENDVILHRLFHEEDVRLFDAHPVSFQCSCSIDKMEQALLHLGYDDAKALLLTHKTISVTCEFCNRHYDFDAVDVDRIFYTPKTP